MPVVINEFEVVPREPAPAAQTGGAPPAGQEPSATPSPHEVAGLVARHAERLERVRAH